MGRGSQAIPFADGWQAPKIPRILAWIVGTYQAMRETPAPTSQRRVSRKVVIYRFAPSGFLGKMLAFVLAVIALVGAFFLSIMVFWIILTLVLFSLVYGWLISRRIRRQDGTVIDVEGEDRHSEPPPKAPG